MNRQKLKSSNLSSAGYDRSTKVLEVEFHHGGVFQYLNVSPQKAAAFSRAESKGTYLNTKIKPQHAARKVK